MSLTDSPAALTRTHQRSASTVLMAVLAFGISACSESPEVATSVVDAAAANEQESDASLVERARAIHDRVITIDTHADINTGNSTMSQGNILANSASCFAHNTSPNFLDHFISQFHFARLHARTQMISQ